MLTRASIAGFLIALSSCAAGEEKVLGTWDVIRQTDKKPPGPIVTGFRVTITPDGSFDAVTTYAPGTPELHEYGWWRFSGSVLAFTYWHSEEPPNEPRVRPDPTYQVKAIEARKLILHDELDRVVFLRVGEPPAQIPTTKRPHTDPKLVGNWRTSGRDGRLWDITLRANGDFTLHSDESPTPVDSWDGWWRVDGKSLLLNYRHPNGSEEDPPIKDELFEIVANTGGKLSLCDKAGTFEWDRVR